MSGKIRVGVLGASGYTGGDLIRLAICHPEMDLVTLTANAHAGKPIGAVFPHLADHGLPDLVTIEEADWRAVDVIFCGLPHGTTQEITSGIFAEHDHIKIIDMSADFRLRSAETYAQWYGHPHTAMDLQAEAVYGLSEHYRAAIRTARLVACPGCYPTAVLMALIPLASGGLVDVNDLVIDAKSGVSGAGRGLKLNTLFCESGEGLSSYSVASHRHAPEIEQEIGRASGGQILINFTPHLVPMSRGEFCTCYVRLMPGYSSDDLRAALQNAYEGERFVQVLEEGVQPASQHVRGSNNVRLAVFADRIPGRAIVIATLDNLVKGSAGQAIQNMNLVCGLDEHTGLEQLALFP